MQNEKRTPLFLKENNKVRNHFFPSQNYFEFLLEAIKNFCSKLMYFRITNKYIVKNFDSLKWSLYE
jgi:hypothetical protein